uniref:Si:ch211-131k2.2 n=1 Tax=Sinocyclocheilus grahami TaxID=75366 RepID=A0A672PYT4_SINGR
MEIWKLSVLMLTILAFACSVQGLSFTLNRDPWISDNWEDEPVEETLASQVASLLKRSKSHQFYGLMGKRSGKTWFNRLQGTKHLQELCSVYLAVL